MAAETQPATVVRIRRASGAVVQGCDVYIGRKMYMGGWRLPASDWANPFTIKETGSAEKACALYETWLRAERPDLLARLPELRGKVLGCWCKPGPCHGDVLVRLLAESDAEADASTAEADASTAEADASTAEADASTAEADASTAEADARDGPRYTLSDAEIDALL